MLSEKYDGPSADHEEQPHLQVPYITWYKHAGLRSLYMRMPLQKLWATINGMNRHQTKILKKAQYNDRGYDSSLLNGLQTIENWRAYFGHPSGSTLGLYTTIVNIGAFSALFFSPYIADQFGRRIATALGCVILIVGVIIQAVPSVNEGMFIGDRFLVGFGSNISIYAGPLLIMELAYPQHRGRLTVMYNTLWDSAFIHAECAEIQATIHLETQAAENGWMVFFQTPGNRKRLLLIVLTSFFSQCSGNGLVSCYLHDFLNSVGIQKPYGQSLFNGCLQIWSFLVAIGFSVYFVEKLGHRMLFLIAAVGMLMVFQCLDRVGPLNLIQFHEIDQCLCRCSAVYADTGNTGAGKAVLTMIFFFYGVASFTWIALTVAYCSEILPYSIRAKGLVICLGVTALSGVLNQYVNPIGLYKLAWRFYIVYIVILVIEVACIWFLFVETKGPTLEEIAVLFGDRYAKASKKLTESGKQERFEEKIEP
ncbi:lactose permease [Fusarium phyllophilum]|uniref:Lactose permease n=1 Tax=Fusarium phyllophilum TaxID=47803 RepID=A0A8H5IBN7_9HYPO|nr:lactose permease [Fusarium phyllophilum]